MKDYRSNKYMQRVQLVMLKALYDYLNERMEKGSKEWLQRISYAFYYASLNDLNIEGISDTAIVGYVRNYVFKQIEKCNERLKQIT